MNLQGFLWAMVIAAVVLCSGCGREAPPDDQETFEAELQQLNEHRQREWNNQ